MDEDQLAELKAKLIELQEEHQDLNLATERMMSQQPVDFIALQRMKKRKLAIKDAIQKIESEMIPDIIA